MALYKVWLTVKDRYGNTKEVDGGTIDVGLGTLTEDEIKVIDEHFATDIDMNKTVENANETIRYSGFEFNDTVEGGN